MQYDINIINNGFFLLTLYLYSLSHTGNTTLMGNVCAKNYIKDECEFVQQINTTVEDRIAEIQQFLTLSPQNTKNITDLSTRHDVKITDFTIEQFIGKGGYGRVYTAVHNQTDEVYAMKIIKKNLLKQQTVKIQTISQRLILESLDHPFLVKLHYAFHNMAKIYMMVDYMEGGQLFYLIRARGKFTEDEARFYAAQIFLALEYLHGKNIMYRDLKPQNILLDLDGHIKITDFGISKVFSQNKNIKTYSVCGTPEYIAPEVLEDKGYTFSSDWYSYGALVYDMIVGTPPYYSKNQMQIVQKKMSHAKISLPRNLSPQTKSFLSELLKVKPEKRLGSNNMSQIKSHPFFSSINFDDILNKRVQPPIQITNNLHECIFNETQLKQSSLKSSFCVKSFHNKLDQQLNYAGFQFNKQNVNKSNRPSTSAESQNNDQF